MFAFEHRKLKSVVIDHRKWKSVAFGNRKWKSVAFGNRKRKSVAFGNRKWKYSFSTSALLVPAPRFLGSADPHQPWKRSKKGSRKSDQGVKTHHLVKEPLPGDGRRPPVGSPWTRPPPLVALPPPQLPVNLSFWIKMCFKSDLSPLCCSACQAPPALSSASPAPPVERGRQPSPLDLPCIGCCSGSTSEHPRLLGI